MRYSFFAVSNAQLAAASLAQKNPTLKFSLFLCGVLIGSGAVLADAVAKDYTCPAQLQVTSGQATPVPGFETWHDPQTPYFVAKIDIYDGHPRDMAQLKPDNGDDPKSIGHSVWTLGDAPQGLWMVCIYDNTDIRMIRRLDGGEKSCVEKQASSANSEAGGDIKLTCK